jgi:hypothetical protein
LTRLGKLPQIRFKRERAIFKADLEFLHATAAPYQNLLLQPPCSLLNPTPSPSTSPPQQQINVKHTSIDKDRAAEGESGVEKMSAHAPTSRSREAPQGDEEASSELKLGEFQDVDALTHSEAALVINALVQKRSVDRKNVNETEYASLFPFLLGGDGGRVGERLQSTFPVWEVLGWEGSSWKGKGKQS